MSKSARDQRQRQSSLAGMKKLPPASRVGPGDRALEKLPSATRVNPVVQAQAAAAEPRRVLNNTPPVHSDTMPDSHLGQHRRIPSMLLQVGEAV